jgi:hypothetical protein
MEIFKDIQKLSKRGQLIEYKVSNNSRVFIKEQYIQRPNGNGRLLQKEKELAYHKNDDGYIVCSIGKLHRIMAQAFIPNPLNKPTVNHINAIKDDNRLENLEWATRKEQTIHFVSLGIGSHPIEINGKKFKSKKEAAKYIGVTPTAVGIAIKESRKCRGYVIKQI